MKSQRKGRGGEIELSALLNEAGFETRPGRPLSYGSEADVVGLPGVHIEVKRTERLRLDDAMNQAIRDAERFGDGVPAVFHRRSRRPWLVTMRLDDWLRLYGGWLDGQTDRNTPDGDTSKRP